MNCRKCLTPLNPNDEVCKVCGEPVVKPKEESVIGDELTLADEEMRVPTESVPEMLMEEEPVEEKKVEVVPPVVETPVKDEYTTSVISPMTAPLPYEQLGITEDKKIAEPKNNKGLIAIIIVITVFVTLAITALIAAPIISKKIDNAKAGNTTTDTTKDKTTSETTNYKVSFAGYSFTLPEDYTYEINDKNLIISNSANTKMVSIEVANAQYTALKEIKSTIKTNLAAAGWTLENLEEKTVKNRSYITIESAVNNKKVLVAYTKASATQVLGLVYLNTTTDDYPTTVIEEFNTIIDSVKATTNSATTITTIKPYVANRIFFG